MAEIDNTYNERMPRVDAIEASQRLRQGKPVIFPTDTVYGVGISVIHAGSPDILFQLKERDASKPVAWLVASSDDLLTYGEHVPRYALDLARRYWPGPLTLIVEASDKVPAAFVSRAGTIGLRMPQSSAVLSLIAMVGSPLATTSANRSGDPAVSVATDIDHHFVQRVDAIMVGDTLEDAIASTVIDCTGDEPVILREGVITLSDVLRVVGQGKIQAQQPEIGKPFNVEYKHDQAESSVGQLSEANLLKNPNETELNKSVPENKDEVVVAHIAYPSADKQSTVQAKIWTTPAFEDGTRNIRGIVQLVHGMAEYIDRYDEFARCLVRAGYVVCGHDHIGHGLSVKSPSDWGHMPLSNGALVLISDLHALRRYMTKRYSSDLPYILFGHSMGSFVVRTYLADYSQGLAGAILSGTGSTPVAVSKMGNKLANMIGSLKGERTHSKILHDLADGSYSKAIKDASTPFDWLSYNTENVDAYIADERCGFMFDAGGYATLTKLVENSQRTDYAQRVNQSLPLLFIAGSEDPVGSCGKGVKEAAQLMEQTGHHDVTVLLYDHMRHEILNEYGREMVIADVLEWIDRVIEASNKRR